MGLETRANDPTARKVDLILILRNCYVEFFNGFCVCNEVTSF